MICSVEVVTQVYLFGKAQLDTSIISQNALKLTEKNRIQIKANPPKKHLWNAFLYDS